jgi:hypothetical protein
MNETDGYINNLPPERQEKIKQIIFYIRDKYPQHKLSCDYGPKTKFPVFKDNKETNYIGIACQKEYMVIHFGKYHCTEIIASANNRIKTGVGCVKIPYTIQFPFEKIKIAVDECFKEA